MLSRMKLTKWLYNASGLQKAMLHFPQEQEAAAIAALQSVTQYYGEDFAEQEPTRMLRTIHEFTLLYNKVLIDIEVQETS